MTTTHVAYDTRSGQIISVHHGAIDATQARQHAHHHAAQHHPGTTAEHIAMITVAWDAVQQGKQYKVDVRRKALVEASAGEAGVGFGFGATGRSS